MTWQLQPLLPAGHNKSHSAGVSLGFPTGLTIICALYFTQYFFVGGPKKQRRYQQVWIVHDQDRVQHFRNGIRRERFF